MNVSKLSVASLAVIAALSAASVQAAWNNVDLNQTGTSGEKLQGSFDYNGKTYGPSSARHVDGQASNTVETNFDLKQLKTNTLYGKHQSDDDHSVKPNDNSFTEKAPVVYRIYRKDYSAAIVNLSRGTQGRNFVKDVVGEKTAPDTLTNGNYTYKGVAFSNFPRGDFTYNVKVTGPSTATGEGSFNLNGIMVPPAQNGGITGHVNITSATLAKTDLVKDGGGLVFIGDVKNINVNDQALWNKIKGNEAQAVYQLGLYGPNGKEIAGTVEGLPDRVGTVALIGGK
ncbi:hypothetical protein RJK40_004887 [Salmonella enterica]|nr:hypothetical protein [Salmonella enterica subsp. enterica]ELC5005253.1 hypothetical protein [Salmonella enterica]